MRNVLAVVLLTTAGLLLSEGSAAETGPLPARNAGARQGQAIGAAIVCPGTHLTKKAEDLGSVYSGSDLDTFNVESSRVAEVWRNLLNCEQTAGPEQCTVVNKKNCSEAAQEIGPTGTVLPGLIELTN